MIIRVRKQCFWFGVPSAFSFDLIANQLFQVHRATGTINAELSIDLFYGKEKTF